MKVVIEDGLRYVYFDGDDAKTQRQSVSYDDDPVKLYLWYSKAVMAFRFWMDDLDRALVVGLGGGSLTRYLYDKFPKCHLWSLEIDQDMVDVAVRELDTPHNDRSEIILESAETYIQRERSYDLIILDAFSGGLNPLVPELNTVEFLEACRDKLTPRGIMISNVLVQKKAVKGRLNEVFKGATINIQQMYQGNQIQLCFKQPGSYKLDWLEERASLLEATEPDMPFNTLYRAVLRNNRHTSHRMRIG
jgi:spermidine synthase